MPKIPTWLLQILVKPIGNLLAGLVTWGVSAFITWLATLNADLAAQINPAAVSSVIWGALMWGLNGWINSQLTEGPKLVQEAMNASSKRPNVKVDGIIRKGGETVRELEVLTGLPVRRATLASEK